MHCLPDEEACKTCGEQGDQYTREQHVADVAGNQVVLVVVDEALEAADDHAERREVRERRDEYRQHALHVAAVSAQDVLHAEHDDELIRDELRAHVLRHGEGFRRVEAEQPGKREHDAAEDVLERDGRMDQHEQHVDELGECDERDDVRADDQHQSSSAEDGVAEEREERLALLAAVIEAGNRVLLLRDLDRMQQVRDNQRIDDVQGHCRQDELGWHHLRVDADQGGCDAAHGHHGERQTAVSLHALELEA